MDAGPARRSGASAGFCQKVGLERLPPPVDVEGEPPPSTALPPVDDACGLDDLDAARTRALDESKIESAPVDDQSLLARVFAQLQTVCPIDPDVAHARNAMRIESRFEARRFEQRFDAGAQGLAELAAGKALLFDQPDLVPELRHPRRENAARRTGADDADPQPYDVPIDSSAFSPGCGESLR